MQLEFDIINQRIARRDNNYIVADSRNYLTAKFNFITEDWDGISKTALFRRGAKTYEMLLNANGECQVPTEVLEHGTVFVSVFGGNLITVDSTSVEIHASGYEQGQTPAEPTPDIYAQIMDKMDKLAAGTVTPEQIAAAVEEYMTAHPAAGITKTDAEKIVEDYVTAHKTELKGDKGETGQPGVTGAPGEKGADGHTPVRGVDYWTEDDISTIQTYIDSQIGGVLNGSY